MNHIDTTECVICLNNISVNELLTLTCCKNDVHIYCLNNWISKNITNKNVSKCFICSQENSMIETLVSYNEYIPVSNNSANAIIHNHGNDNNDNNDNSIIIRNNNINNELILTNDTNMMDIAYTTDRRLYYIYISIKLTFLILVSLLLMFVVYFII
jgi:hypothetical protein